MKIKRPIFYVVTLAFAVLIPLFILETSYFVYKKYIKKEPLVNDSNEIDFSIAGLFIPDEINGHILKPGASTSDLPNWKKKKEDYDRLYHGLGRLISTNEDGYRGTLYDVIKPDNTIRILTLGGSTTWGCFNNDGETWSDYLEKSLRIKVEDKKVEVINGAVGGYSSVQNLELVKRKFQYYKPDIVLIACWFNDMYIRGPRTYSTYPDLDQDYHVNSIINSTQKNTKKFLLPLKGVNAAYIRVRNALDYLIFKLTAPAEHIDGINNPTKSFFKNYYSEDKVWITDYLHNIDEIASISRKNQSDAEIFIVALPTFFAPERTEHFQEKLDPPAYDINMYHRSYLSQKKNRRFLFAMYYHHTILFQELLQSKEKKIGFKMILGYPALGRIPLNERNKYFNDEMHLTAEGNRLLSMEVARQLAALSPKFNP